MVVTYPRCLLIYGSKLKTLSEVFFHLDTAQRMLLNSCTWPPILGKPVAQSEERVSEREGR
jgi:hypothetical protein